MLAAAFTMPYLVGFVFGIVLSRTEPGMRGQEFADRMLAAFIATRRVEVPLTCVPPAFEPGGERYNRQVGEESQTTLFLCLRATERSCERFSLFNTCRALEWPAEVRIVPGLLDHLEKAHRESCRIFVPVAGEHLRQWRETGLFPQALAEGEALLLDGECGWWDYTLIMKVRSAPS